VTVLPESTHVPRRIGPPLDLPDPRKTEQEFAESRK